MNDLKIYFISIMLFLLIPISVFGKDKVDSQGNRYSIDKNGSIFTYGEPMPNRQPASIENLPYYYNETLNLLGKKHTADGLIMATEILDLPELDANVKIAKWSIGVILGRMLSEEELNKTIPVIKHREEDIIVYRNRLYNFELRYPLSFKIFSELAGIKKDTMTNVGFLIRDSKEKGAPVNIIFFAKHLNEKITLDEFSSQWNLPSGCRIVKTIAYSKLFDAETKGNQLEWVEKETSFVGEQIWLVKDGIGYYIVLSSPRVKYEVTEKIFREFLSNIKISKISSLQYISDDDPNVKSFLREQTSK